MHEQCPLAWRQVFFSLCSIRCHTPVSNRQVCVFVSRVTVIYQGVFLCQELQSSIKVCFHAICIVYGSTNFTCVHVTVHRSFRYRRCDEIVWVKTNQLQRIIRTGRTGHWLNHGKEHCLVGGEVSCTVIGAVSCTVSGTVLSTVSVAVLSTVSVAVLSTVSGIVWHSVWYSVWCSA